MEVASSGTWKRLRNALVKPSSWGLRKAANDGVNLPDRGAIEGEQGRVLAGCVGAIGRCSIGWQTCGPVVGSVAVASC